MRTMRLLYAAFEVAVCMVEEIKDRGIDLENKTLDEAERELGYRRNTLGRQEARMSFKPYSRQNQARAYVLARDLASRLLQEVGS